MSSTPIKFLFALALACTLTGPLTAQTNDMAMATAAPTDLTGYWVLHVPNADGTARDTFFQLTLSGTSITGQLLGRGTAPIAGDYKDESLHFATVPPQTGANPARPTVFTGAYRNGSLLLHVVNARGQTSDGYAERTTLAATLPPARIPLPAVRPVPDNNLARTPPMGWNSWNKFAGRVDDASVRTMADAMVSSGMAKLGYTYINIDDTWELGRDAQGNITANKKFPDMKALADYVHAKGLKIGIYSSPGPKTCAGYMASYGHETQDATTFAAWGIDYLKYDMCSARDMYKSNREDEQPLYQKMGDALQATGRPIVYSLCQYGQGDVWNWGALTGGNLWRTTGDISDRWASMDKIGFSQLDLPFGKPGHWNDPDMLEIGNGGMSADEYRTHMTLWSMLAAPLIAGNDLRAMSDETKSILMNPDVIAIDQDPDANPIRRLPTQGKLETLTRTLHDGTTAVAIFNRGNTPTEATYPVGPSTKATDLWKHQPITPTGTTYTTTIPTHGVVLLKLTTK
jgi:alpha-galactosidase